MKKTTHYSLQAFIEGLLIDWDKFLALCRETTDDDNIKEIADTKPKDYTEIWSWMSYVINKNSAPQPPSYWSDVERRWKAKVNWMQTMDYPIFFYEPTKKELKAYFNRPKSTGTLYFKEFLENNSISWDIFLQRLKPRNQRWGSHTNYHCGYNCHFRRDPEVWIMSAFDSYEDNDTFYDELVDLANKWEQAVVKARVDDQLILAEPTSKSTKTLYFTEFLKFNGVKPKFFKELCDPSNQGWDNPCHYHSGFEALDNMNPSNWVDESFNWENTKDPLTVEMLNDLDIAWSQRVKETAIEVIKLEKPKNP